MIFTGFKYKSNQIFFKKNVEKLIETNRFQSEDKIKSVLFITDDEYTIDEVKDTLPKVLGLDNKNVDYILFQSRKSRGLAHYNVVSPGDFGWNGKIKADAVNAITKKKYDVIINYSRMDIVYINILLLQTKTTLRIGLSHLDKSIYDLMINCEPNNISVINSEIKKYLIALNKL